MKIAIVFGTRPEIIKISPIANYLSRTSKMETVLISTGQHSELNAMTLKDLGLVADYDLSLMSSNQSLAQFGAKCLSQMHELLESIEIDGLIVQGDTSTAFYSALAAYYLGIPIFHVEAGLRSHDLSNPFPEEMNRLCISRIANFNFAPTQLAFENLLRENISPSKILVTGNTVVDALHELARRSEKPSLLSKGLSGYKKNILLTMHRRENHDALGEFLRNFSTFALERPDIGVWLPSHPNPNVQSQLVNISADVSNLKILEALPYSEFVSVMSRMDLIVTDSGGVQEEAVALGKRVIVVRETTERPEGLMTGLASLISIKNCKLQDALNSGLEDSSTVGNFAEVYGDGKAAERIVTQISSILEGIK